MDDLVAQFAALSPAEQAKALGIVEAKLKELGSGARVGRWELKPRGPQARALVARLRRIVEAGHG